MDIGQVWLLCVSVVLSSEMRRSNTGHLCVCTQYFVVWRRWENLSLVIFCASVGGGKCYMVIGYHM